MNIDNLKDITKLDREDMLDLLVSFPKQCKDALFIGEHSSLVTSYKKNYANIVFTGLGGSAIGADVIKGYVGGEISIPIFVNRTYAMPHFVNRETLVFAASYSGNTEETLSAYADAKKRQTNVVAITSGVKLKDLALKNKDMLIIIPKGYPPRCALGYSFIPALTTLSKLGIIKDKKEEIKNAVRFLNNLQGKKLASSVKGRANVAKNIARKIRGKVPVIYASDKLGSVATRWRGQIAENSKTLASSHVFPEMNHNEIVGWVHPKNVLKNFVAIVLRDKEDCARVKKRMDITVSILKRSKFSVLELESEGKSPLERILSLIYTGDFVSFYLSILNGINPAPVDRITYLKKQLAK